MRKVNIDREIKTLEKKLARAMVKRAKREREMEARWKRLSAKPTKGSYTAFCNAAKRYAETKCEVAYLNLELDKFSRTLERMLAKKKTTAKTSAKKRRAKKPSSRKPAEKYRYMIKDGRWKFAKRERYDSWRGEKKRVIVDR